MSTPVPLIAWEAEAWPLAIRVAAARPPRDVENWIPADHQLKHEPIFSPCEQLAGDAVTLAAQNAPVSFCCRDQVQIQVAAAGGNCGT
jgi:hypothetical protein